MTNQTRIYSDAYIWQGGDVPPVANYNLQYPDEPAYVNLYHPRSNSNELVPFTDSNWTNITITTPFDGGGFTPERKIAIFWDWNVPTYCRNQALSLGFTNDDLTSPPPPELGEETYDGYGGESGFTNSIELRVTRGRTVISSGFVKYFQNIIQTIPTPAPEISYSVHKAFEAISPGNVSLAVVVVKEEYEFSEGYTGYQGNLLDISTLSPEAWWDANDNSTISTRYVEDDGAYYITEWNDKSGNGWNLTQPVEASQPVFFVYDGIIPIDGTLWNGIPNSLYLQSAPGSFTIKEFYVVCYNDIDFPINQGLFNPSDASTSWFTTSADGTFLDSPSEVYLNGNNVDNVSADVTTIMFGSTILFRVVLPAVTTVTDGVVMGSDRIFNTDTGWSGGILELVVFSSELTVSERESLETHLMEKWRINADPGDYFSNSQVTVDVDVISANLVNYVWEVSPPSLNIQSGIDIVDVGVFSDSDIRNNSPDWSAYPTVQDQGSSYDLMYIDIVS
ncbi:hypothetical protein SCRM01_007 [Synechococcus phage S-CRM01]|uniref:virion structural protein n=1 Tax=Synechococcus phage S-CRM01 TaxID=1026955 RepID=UPI000209E331|nr:virion structural protein [Synechococcus phage S-CRM01]AEC52955.1 hypothetical protein SCRM01_007 [Synechococcus phage S-CRM01]